MKSGEYFETKSILSKSTKYLLVVSIILFCLFYRNISYALGFVLGGMTCLINFKLMVRSLEGMVSKTTYSRAFFNGHFLLRLLLALGVLYGAATLESVNLLTAVIGISTVRIIIIWEAITRHIKSLKYSE